ncbi:hypothetical protein ASE95_08490 [Sphingomonas sp. Leaf231]|uniref:DUF2243 domain-containing protein n=1 Tax=Sphingomonas sp. Leaf231 TaxID=1736301 RepID=UPI0006F8A7E8|nr:DUF2243 domain-containing protein [Sphingomonas sp. Leaf231]KQN92699.1 hypothetical protein ASE95_08490 [Sphingomonas sp. Leaf231]
MDHPNPTTKPLVTAGLTIGIGMGGFVDGIVFHQILQIHNMLSARISTDTLVGAKVNMVWDGLFHAAVWIATAAGIMLLWRAVRRPDVVLSGKVLFGATLMGFGLFNLVEGVIDHHLLGLHHVYERWGRSIWDYVFLGSGVALFATGWLMARTARD